ncbi:histidine kinase [Kineobactrum sediminis]|uniref:Histidine kinase n=1 Tax=Kineobactrum sediminis TaxID=1905677 RepID=A0A2N5Y6L0_9GAMM|nr:HDOD domain-containing protein [Kineobactrum sediminis]PLW83999.1 histidine kinase [Kineobactrum sediminis]
MNNLETGDALAKAAATAPDSKGHQVHFARQPIFDGRLEVYGYEMLFRESPQNEAAITPGSQAGKIATARVMLNSIMDLDVEKLTEGKMAFFNLSREFLLDDNGLLLNGTNIGVELLSSAGTGSEVVRALEVLALQGVVIALDDFSWQAGIEQLLDSAALVKLDIQKADRAWLASTIIRLRNWPVKLVAQKVETQEEFAWCKAQGFDYFQGYFLCKPTVVEQQRLPDSKINTLRLIAELQKPDITPEDLEAVIRNDMALHYRLLRTVNSTYYGLSVEVKSIGHAVVILGMATVKRWAHLQLVAGSDDTPAEIIRQALIRARMCEQLIPTLPKETRDTAFTTGMFSLLEAILDSPMTLIVSQLPLDQDMADALTRHEGPFGRLLKAVIAYEQGQWDELDNSLFSTDDLAACYLEAVQWAREQFDELSRET